MNRLELVQWIKKDITIIIVCLLSLLACLYTIYTVGSYQQAINQHWIDQWEQTPCAAESVIYPQPADIQYNIIGEYDQNGNKDID